MEEQTIGYLDWENWGLKMTISRGRLCQLLFVAKGKAAGALQPELAESRQQLLDYLKGSRRGFTLELDPAGTEFQKKVWNALLEIPYGETRSYKQIAERIGRPKAFRAVGQAANKNPIPIVIPCHRLVGTNGSLTGYAGGLELKRYLLELERRTLEQE